MKTWIVGSVMALAIGSNASFSLADSVTLKSTYSGSFIGLNSVLTVNVGLPSGTSTVGTVGAYGWDVQPGSSSVLGTGSIHTYCIQLKEYFSGGGTYTYELNNDVFGSAKGGTADAGYIDLLAAKQLQGLINLVGWTNSFSASGGYTAAERAAAFQLAVWEIEYDGGGVAPPPTGEAIGTFQTRDFYFTHGIITVDYSNSGAAGKNAIDLSTSWLNTLVAADVTSAVALNNPASGNDSGCQDQLGFKVVPVPAALPVGIAMLAGMAVVRKIRRRA
jgi:hypothetical protein